MREEPDQQPDRRRGDPAKLALEKVDELRMHAQLYATFEGTRKFDAVVRPGFDPKLARDIQQRMAKLEKKKVGDTPVIDQPGHRDASRLLNVFQARKLPTNDYHVYGRPGEVMVFRWLAGDEVQTFYERLQAHMDAALEGEKEDQRNAHGWKQDARSQAYLDALEKIRVNMEERYLRPLIRKGGLYVLSTQVADEMNIAFLCEQVMEVASEDLVGPSSAPPDMPTERDLAWFFKLFSLRGMKGKTERMCFFAYLQKAGEEW